MLWRPGLFLVSIVAVTSSGRAAADEYASETMTRLAEQAPFSYEMLAAMGVIVLICMLLMCDLRFKRRHSYMIWREIRYTQEHE